MSRILTEITGRYVYLTVQGVAFAVEDLASTRPARTVGSGGTSWRTPS